VQESLHVEKEEHIVTWVELDKGSTRVAALEALLRHVGTEAAEGGT